MKKAEINKLMDLIDDIKKLDGLIAHHREIDESDFVVSQYEAKK